MTQGKPERCPSDVCECGEYRSQHDNDGPCKICAKSKAPYDGCAEFRFSRAATVTEQVHWDDWHSPVPAAAPQLTEKMDAAGHSQASGYGDWTGAPQAESVPSTKCDCGTSTGICGSTTRGKGRLDHNGYWEFPCPHGNAFEDEKPAKSVPSGKDAAREWLQREHSAFVDAINHGCVILPEDVANKCEQFLTSQTASLRAERDALKAEVVELKREVSNLKTDQDKLWQGYNAEIECHDRTSSEKLAAEREVSLLRERLQAKKEG